MRQTVRIASSGHAAFAATMISLGVLGLINGDLATIWHPLPKTPLVRQGLVYLCAAVALGSGIGMLFHRTAAATSRILFGFLLAWLLLMRVPYMVIAFGVNTWWAAGQVAVTASAAWVLYVWLAGEQDRLKLSFAAGDGGLRLARTLFGIGLFPFGLAHFLYLGATAPLVPAWLPWHTAWAYLTGASFLAAGVGVIVGVWPRLAAALVTAQVAGFTLLVWGPVVVAGATLQQWREFITSYAITAGAWVIADSYRGTPWLAVGKR